MLSLTVVPRGLSWVLMEESSLPFEDGALQLKLRLLSEPEPQPQTRTKDDMREDQQCYIIFSCCIIFSCLTAGTFLNKR